MCVCVCWSEWPARQFHSHALALSAPRARLLLLLLIASHHFVKILLMHLFVYDVSKMNFNGNNGKIHYRGISQEKTIIESVFEKHIISSTLHNQV